MLRLLSSRVQEHRFFLRPFKQCHVGIHWKALAESYQMSDLFAKVELFFHHFLLTKLATSSTRVKIKFRFVCFQPLSNE